MEDSAAQECIDLADAAGVHLDPWQQFCIRVILARNARGRWAALEAAILVARQNGKGEILLALELYWLFLTDVRVDRLIVHTAHEFKTSTEAFLRLKAVIDANDWMVRRVRKPTNSHGEEGFLMMDKRRLRFLARSLNSGRGFTGDKVILDEAQQLPTFAMDALMPTLSARPDPQLVYAGTVPSIRNDAAHWTKLMNRGRGGKGKRLAWIEFNGGERLPPEALYMGDDPDKRMRAEIILAEFAVAGNPALGYRLEWDFMDAERESLSWEGFLRERLNVWSLDPVTMVIPMDIWLSLQDPGSTIVGRRAIAVDCPPGLGAGTIAAMGRRSDGRWHGEIVARHAGTEWIPARVAEVVRKNGDVAAVVVDPGSPAGALIPDIEAEGVEVLQVTTRQHAQACGMLYTRCTEVDETGSLKKGFMHLGDPILEEALKVAVQRPGPDGTWLWNRKDSGDDISPVVSLTLAGFGLSTLPEEVADPWMFLTP